LPAASAASAVGVKNRAAVAAVAVATAGDRVDDSVGRHAPHAAVARVRDVDIPGGVHGDALRLVQQGLRPRPAVAAEAGAVPDPGDAVYLPVNRDAADAVPERLYQVKNPARVERERRRDERVGVGDRPAVALPEVHQERAARAPGEGRDDELRLVADHQRGGGSVPGVVVRFDRQARRPAA
jgi:hypothetical protein